MAESKSLSAFVTATPLSNYDLYPMHRYMEVVDTDDPPQKTESSRREPTVNEGIVVGPEHPNQMCITKKIGIGCSFKIEPSSG